MYIVTIQKPTDKLPVILFQTDDLARASGMFRNVDDAYMGVKSIEVRMFFQGSYMHG